MQGIQTNIWEKIKCKLEVLNYIFNTLTKSTLVVTTMLIS